MKRDPRDTPEYRAAHNGYPPSPSPAEEEVNWKELVGKKVSVKSSPYQIGDWEVTVSSYDNGYVTFSNDKCSYPESQLVLNKVYDMHDDITNELEPLDFISVYIAQALNRAYVMKVSRWAWDMYEKEARVISACLTNFGLTNEMIKNNPRFEEILRKGY